MHRFVASFALSILGCSRAAPLPPDGASMLPTTTPESSAPALSGDAPAAPFALVELFTSEGCSSCPPADALLADIDEKARARGESVYPLSFHVDYWNGLGWRDPFSDEAYSTRQEVYARAFGGGTFTPNMIVNGAESFVGSDRARAERAIDEALSSAPAASVAVDAEAHASRVTVHFTTRGAPASALVYVALVQASATSQALSGENGGKTLRHVDVVRALASTLATAEGVETLTVPDGMPQDGASVVAWVQRSSTTHVLAAARAPLTVAARPGS